MARACEERDGSGCFYCGRELDLDSGVLDHFLPQSKGGSDRLVNRRLACPACDGAKGALTPWEFMPDRFSEDDLPEDD